MFLGFFNTLRAGTSFTKGPEIMEWVSNYILIEPCDVITYPACPDFNCGSIKNRHKDVDQ